MSDAPQRIDAGSYVVRLRCPRCHQFAELIAEIRTRLTVDEGGESGIRVLVRSKPIPHRCGQRTLIDVSDDDDQTEIPGQLRNDDWAERAAGSG